jgi:glycosyltransferase involved in cell wall biosynthesis
MVGPLLNPRRKCRAKPRELKGPELKLLYVQPAYFDNKSYIGGGERYPVNLARAATRGDGSIEVTIVSFGPSSRHVHLAPNVSLQICEAINPSAGLLDLTSAHIAPLIESADMIHVFQPFTRCGEAASVAALARGKPLILTDLGGSSSNVGALSGLIGLADAIVCISEFSADRYKQFRHPRHTVLSGPFDDDKFGLSTSRVGRTSEFLFVGRILPHKGIDLLVRALPPGASLAICGRVYHTEYFSLLQSLAAGKSVRFITDASDEDLLALYCESLAVVLPSVHNDVFGNYHPHPELLGLSLLEGAACGCFAICNNVGGMPEFIGDEICGAVFRDEAELAFILSTVLDNADQVKDPSNVKHRSQWAATRFGLAAVGERIGQVYKEAMER